MNDGPSEEATATAEVAVLQNSLTGEVVSLHGRASNPPTIIHDDRLLTEAAELIPAALPFEIYCDARLPCSPFVCTREPHEDEPHVSHDAAGRAMALWPMESFAIVRVIA